MFFIFIGIDLNQTTIYDTAPKKPFYKYNSIDNMKHSPCKLIYDPFSINGNTIPSYECAEKKEQKNNFTNLECATIKKPNQVIKILINGKLKIFRRDIGVGCELRFKRHLNYLNELFGQGESFPPDYNVTLAFSQPHKAKNCTWNFYVLKDSNDTIFT